MADLQPPVGSSTAERTEYQPVSLVALAAVIVGGLLTVIVLIFAVTALWSRKPVVFTPLLFLAVIGLALSVAARIQVERSEGTRAGRRLASIGWWMSVLGGACYTAYIAAIIMAIRQQSLDITNQWFNSLKSGDFNSAFLVAIEPGKRTGINPRNTADLTGRFGEIELPAFRGSELVRIVQRNADQIELVPQGVRDWTHEPNGFRVIRPFLLKCPEGEFEIVLSLFGHEGRDLSRRVWSIESLGEGTIAKRRFSGYGRAVVELQFEAGNLGREFFKSLSQKNRELAFLYTLEAEPRKVNLEKKLVTDVGQIVSTLAQPLNLGFTPVAAGMLLAPVRTPEGIDRFVRSGFFRLPGGGSPDSDQQQTFETIWKGFNILPAGGGGLTGTEQTPRIEVADDAVRASVATDLTFPEKKQYAKGRLLLVANNPELLQRLRELKQAALANPNEADYSQNTALGKVPRDWRVVGLESDLALFSPPMTQDPSARPTKRAGVSPDSGVIIPTESDPKTSGDPKSR